MKTALTIFSSVTFMKEVSEGVGTKVRRLLPVAGTEQLDPFLLFDYFNGKLPGGFPDHPHRGFETVTYLLKGQFFHEDFKGHKGTLSPGGVQWMTAGRGIVHSEMPASATESSEGYQLWINLPKAKKMVPPNYQEFLAEQIPEFKGEGFSVKVIAGEFEGVKGGVNYSHPIEYVVFSMKSGAKASYTFKKEWNGLLVVSEGEVEVNGEKVQKFHGGIFNRRAEDVRHYAMGLTAAGFS